MRPGEIFGSLDLSGVYRVAIQRAPGRKTPEPLGSSTRSGKPLTCLFKRVPLGSADWSGIQLLRQLPPACSGGTVH
jgi:hypothetical protein